MVFVWPACLMKFSDKSFAMTWFAEQLNAIKNAHYHPDELCQRIIEAKQYIDTNFSENINLDDIAEKACYSKFHFRKLFKQLYGLSPHQYLTFVRINNAKQLLQCGIPTADVCLAVGFESISSFKNLFKRHTSLTPAAWVQHQQKRKLQETAYRFLPYWLHQ